jgi:two-component system, OmpR family, alkaline phosphatase synthesis response regulator PhoP
MAKKILLVEDEEIMIKILQRKMENEGFEVTVTRDGREGLESMKKTAPDIVLLDIIMPNKGGFEVLEDMVADENLKNIPVIIISNSGQPVELDRAKKLGVCDWLVKTNFDPQEVADKVIKQIGK